MPDGQSRPNGPGGPYINSGAAEKQYTGGSLVLLREAVEHNRLERNLGLKVVRSSDFKNSNVNFEELGERDALLLDEIGVVIIPGAPRMARPLQVLSEDADADVLAVEPEQIMHAIASPQTHSYRQGLSGALQHMAGRHTVEETVKSPTTFDETRMTWGLQVTKVEKSRFSGQKIKVAVLDTGIDLHHPDFRGRKIRYQSFIAGEAAQDGHGHGTHCIGTACGSGAPAFAPRYGCAFRAEIFAGKVLSNTGSGADRSILAGVNWAIANGCQIISMSLGAPTSIGERPSPVYEQVARRALARGVLIVAAAGNESVRPARIKPVGRPANCPSIMAVGAIDQDFRVTPFSNGGLNAGGSAVDIMAPGIEIFSSVPMRRRHSRFNGTSMAASHVAGIAAMYKEATGLVGHELWSRLVQTSRRLNQPATDIGAGLVQAP